MGRNSTFKELFLCCEWKLSSATRPVGRSDWKKTSFLFYQGGFRAVLPSNQQQNRSKTNLFLLNDCRTVMMILMVQTEGDLELLELLAPSEENILNSKIIFFLLEIRFLPVNKFIFYFNVRKSRKHEVFRRLSILRVCLVWLRNEQKTWASWGDLF